MPIDKMFFLPLQLFPEKHNHEKLLLYHNIDRAQTYRFVRFRFGFSGKSN